jgi:hypothetical protein
MTRSVRLPNGRSWRTQSEAMDHFKEVLSRSTLGERVTAADDHADLSALLQAYDSVLPPGAPTKTGAGVAFFSKQRNRGEGWSSDGFHVHRIDGTQIDFSYKEAVRVASGARR